MEAQVAAEMRRYVVETWLGGDGRGLCPDTYLQEAGLLDSFAMLALVGHLGDAFEVEPADVNGETFRCIRAIARLVVERMGERTGAP
jgi:acyl carrier protein